MSTPAAIETARLVLRPFGAADGLDVQRIAGDERVAREISLIPHPYPDGVAQAWIATHESSEAAGRTFVRAITCKDTGALLGCIELARTGFLHSAELGYWLGVDHWGQGIVTEAAEAFVAWAFKKTSFERVQSRHATSNPASGRILQKIGMRREGIASRMLQGLLDHCFDQIGLHRIWAETFVDNEPSRRLLDRNGFSFEGVKRQAYLKEDRYLDTDMWAMLATAPRPWKEQTS